MPLIATARRSQRYIPRISPADEGVGMKSVSQRLLKAQYYSVFAIGVVHYSFFAYPWPYFSGQPCTAAPHSGLGCSKMPVLLAAAIPTGEGACAPLSFLTSNFLVAFCLWNR